MESVGSLAVPRLLGLEGDQNGVGRKVSGESSGINIEESVCVCYESKVRTVGENAHALKFGPIETSKRLSSSRHVPETY